MKRPLIGAMAALGLSFVLGGVVVPALRGASASAQTQPTSAQASASPSAAASSKSNGLRNQFLDQLADELNIDRSALDSAITAAGASTLDAAVQQGTLTQARADAIKARLQSGDLGAFGRGGGSKGNRSSIGVQQAMWEAAAQQLGLSVDEFRAQLRGGQTLAQLAQANNTTEQAVIDAALAAAKTRLDQAVAAGTLTQARADEIYAGLQQRGADLFNGRGRGPGKHGRPGSPATPSPTPTPAG